MKTYIINVWSPKPESLGKLFAAGVKNALFEKPWSWEQLPPFKRESVWAMRVVFDKDELEERNHLLRVGWIIGVLGLPVGTVVDFEVLDGEHVSPHVPPVDVNDVTTTDGKPPAPGHERGTGTGAPQPIEPATGQHGAYWVLSEAERARGFVRPVRKSYIHQKCGGLTTMGAALAETYARKPDFYNATFCATCKAHFPVGLGGEFIWDGTSEKVGT